MEAMQAELLAHGKDVNVVVINIDNGLKYQDKLIEKCSFPLLQDSEEVGAWDALNGNKDDFYIYGSNGKLAIFLPIDGDVSVNLQTVDGYANVRDIMMAVP